MAESAVAWSSAGGRAWQAGQLPGRFSAIDSAGVSEATTTSNGTAVAVGRFSLARGSRAAVWLKRPTDLRWRAVSSPTFISPVADNYGFYDTDAVAAGADGVVIAGSHYADGHQDLAFWFSADGASWQHGTGDRAVKLSAHDKSDNRSPYPGFRAPVNGSIAVEAVQAVGDGFLAAGSITTGGRDRPTIWRSTDGRVWSDPISLLSAAGIWSADVNRVARTGKTISATATGYRSASDPDGHLTSWTSVDGGVTWLAGTTLAERSRAFDLISIPGGFLAAGDMGTAADRDVAAWTSRDGLTWKRAQLALSRAAGPGLQLINDVVVRDQQLLVVAEDAQPTGGGYYSTWVALPEP